MGTEKTNNVRIVINAQILQPDTVGGVATFIIGLVRTLGELEGPEEYLIVVHPGNPGWLKRYLGANQRTVLAPGKFTLAKRVFGPYLSRFGHLLQGVPSPGQRSSPVRVPDSSRFYESLCSRAVHFPHPNFTRSGMPMVITLHDLQHMHYPQFFHPAELDRRNAFYSAACQVAQVIATDAKWGKQDLIASCRVPPEKIFSITMAPPTDVYAPITPSILQDVRARFSLPENFMLFPANTWEHKNHLGLLKAMAQVRARDQLSLDLVCTGRKDSWGRVIDRHIRELGLDRQIRFLGYVSSSELRALYHLAQFVIYPSLFEGGGLPVLEAFREDAPIACSNVTALPEYAGDAALLFDPLDVDSIANALCRMSTDPVLRQDLRRRGRERARLFTWERTAKTYRALYRKIAGAELSGEDSRLLAEC